MTKILPSTVTTIMSFMEAERGRIPSADVFGGIDLDTIGAGQPIGLVEPHAAGDVGFVVDTSDTVLLSRTSSEWGRGVPAITIG